jgi:hypothetical protein
VSHHDAAVEQQGRTRDEVIGGIRLLGAMHEVKHREDPRLRQRLVVLGR